MREEDIKFCKNVFSKVLGNPKYLDRTIVKPASFIFSQFTDKPFYFTKKRELMMYSINAKLLNPLPDHLQGQSDVERDELHYDAEFFPIQPKSDVLNLIFTQTPL